MTPTIVVCIAVLIAVVVFVVIMLVGFVLARRRTEQ
jgi:uncharacterized protein YneF (UPF0154 family)